MMYRMSSSQTDQPWLHLPVKTHPSLIWPSLHAQLTMQWES